MKYLRLIYVPIFLLPLTFIQPQSGDVHQVVAKWNSLKSFKANITISSGGGQGLSGVLSFHNGKMNLRLSGGRVIASTGSELVVFDPSTGVAGKQELISKGGGLGWILNGYSVKSSGNTAHLIADNESVHFKEVRLNWGDDYMLKQISMKGRNSSDWLTIKISNIIHVESFPSNIFSYKPPAGSRTVENPLNQRN
ncbi:MAG: hypothetical protein OEZ34_07650 [Spirochaetia bacterium]|nr:hypothetical protein [Spirochaetia bacterium]